MNFIAFLASPGLLFSASRIHAAEAPKDTEKPGTQATPMVRGKVIGVAATVEKSRFEISQGIHKDTIYTITVAAEEISKGNNASIGPRINVKAGQPHTRKPNPHGSRAHEPTPSRAATAALNLTDGQNHP